MIVSRSVVAKYPIRNSFPFVSPYVTRVLEISRVALFTVIAQISEFKTNDLGIRDFPPRSKRLCRSPSIRHEDGSSPLFLARVYAVPLKQNLPWAIRFAYRPISAPKYLDRFKYPSRFHGRALRRRVCRYDPEHRCVMMPP